MSAAELCPMSSYMSPETREAFCNRPVPKAFVYNLRSKPRAGVVTGADVIKCRTSCLKNLSSSLWRTRAPVFAPTDTIEPTHGRAVELTHIDPRLLGGLPGGGFLRKPTAGFLYVHKPLDGVTEPTPPYRGSDWYPIAVVKWP